MHLGLFNNIQYFWCETSLNVTIFVTTLFSVWGRNDLISAKNVLTIKDFIHALTQHYVCSQADLHFSQLSYVFVPCWAFSPKAHNSFTFCHGFKVKHAILKSMLLKCTGREKRCVLLWVNQKIESTTRA